MTEIQQFVTFALPILIPTIFAGALPASARSAADAWNYNSFIGHNSSLVMLTSNPVSCLNDTWITSKAASIFSVMPSKDVRCAVKDAISSLDIEATWKTYHLALLKNVYHRPLMLLW